MLDGTSRTQENSMMVDVRRRKLAPLALAVLGVPALASRATAQDGGPGVQASIARFASVTPAASCLVVVERPGASWRAAHQPNVRMFVGSAIKTFILAQFMRDVEAGRLTETQQTRIDDSVRSISSPVFLEMTGTTPAKSALEAMITHSDNTATDVALAAVGPDRVRALIAEAGLAATQIPDSTRRMFSYLAGAPEGVDVGWAGMQRLIKEPVGKDARPALNDRHTMASTSEDLVKWYQQALRGAFFQQPDTLLEFKRIQAMADALAYVAPPDTLAYGKGGSIDWNNFHCFSLAGQMIVAKVPVTFCFTVNWTGPDDGVSKVFGANKDAVAGVLEEAAKTVA
jgi:beta-lactamase class A